MFVIPAIANECAPAGIPCLAGEFVAMRQVISISVPALFAVATTLPARRRAQARLQLILWPPVQPGLQGLTVTYPVRVTQFTQFLRRQHGRITDQAGRKAVK